MASRPLLHCTVNNKPENSFGEAQAIFIYYILNHYFTYKWFGNGITSSPQEEWTVHQWE